MNHSKDTRKLAGQKISRRNFLKLGFFATAISIFPFPSFADIHDSHSREKVLSFYNIHTRESLRTVYRDKGEYVPEALKSINYIMRDHRGDKIKTIDTNLLDLLYAIHSRLNTRQYFHIISGYRSPATNAFLIRHSSGVARNSLHMYGKAVDIRVPNIPLPLVRQAAVDLGDGGVGYYPDSNFIHIDVGELHYW